MACRGRAQKRSCRATTDDPDAPEIFSEPEHLIKPLKRLAKKHTAYYILLCLMAVLLLLEFVVHLRSCRHLKKLIKHIERGGELPTGEHYKAKSKIGAVLIPLTIPVIILWFVHLAIPMGEVYLHGTNDLSGLPFPTMQEINIDEYNYYVDGLKKVDGASLANISKSHDLLAPTMIDFSQDCSLFENITGEDENSFEYNTPTYDIRDLSRDGGDIKLVNEKYGYGRGRHQTVAYHAVWEQVYQGILLRKQQFGRIYRFVYHKA